MNVSVPSDQIKEEEVIMVWNESWPAFRLFLDLETQWRTVATLAGYFHVGLDYVAAAVLLDLRFSKRRRRREIMSDLQAMEAEALAVFVKHL